MSGLIIFDLQRFALHDGPGIRTTIFLKGCPLDCLWCHNPESKRMAPQLRFQQKKCVGCARCVTACRQGVHKIENGVHAIDYKACTGCGACVKNCAGGALTIYGKKANPEELIDTVLRDRDFYERSGGGLTVSGGEPMLQFEGLKELLRLAKKEGIHVCLDTCGQAPEDRYQEIAEYVDLFLFDYKLTDPLLHQKYTGVDNQLILRNLDGLCRKGSRVFLRCPIIPGINDNDRHYQAIAKLSRTYDQILEVNLMTYHDMAKGKAAEIGARYGLMDLKTIEAEEKRKIYERVASFGCRDLKES